MSGTPILDEFYRASYLPSDYQKIGDYLLIEETVLAPADAIMIFGNRHTIPQSAERAVNLFNKGLGEKIIVTGGRTTANKFSESAEIRQNLLKKGMNDNDIIVEDLSTNTQENIEFTRFLIEENSLNSPINSIITVGTVVAGRRFLMTLQKFWPNVFAMAANVNPFDVVVQNWDKCSQFKKVVLQEFNKIEPYFDKGFLKEIDINEINKKAVQMNNDSHNNLKCAL